MRRSKPAGTGARPPSIRATVRAIGDGGIGGQARRLRDEAQRERRQQCLDDRRGVLRKFLVGRRASAPARWCRGSQPHRRCAGHWRRSRFRRPIRRRAARRSAQGSPLLRTASAPCSTRNNASDGSPWDTSICAAHEIPADHGAKGPRSLFGAECPEQREVLGHAAPRKCRARIVHRQTHPCDGTVLMLSPDSRDCEQYEDGGGVSARPLSLAAVSQGDRLCLSAAPTSLLHGRETPWWENHLRHGLRWR